MRWIRGFEHIHRAVRQVSPHTGNWFASVSLDDGGLHYLCDSDLEVIPYSGPIGIERV